MNESLLNVFLWMHLLCMVGAFGALLAGGCVPPDAGAETSLRVLKRANLLIAIGFLAGLATYFVRIKLASLEDIELPGSLHMTVGIKFLILIGVGACVGIALAKTRKSDAAQAAPFRWAAVILLAIAAFLGVYL
jgi:hypothetical protein